MKVAKGRPLWKNINFFNILCGARGIKKDYKTPSTQLGQNKKPHCVYISNPSLDINLF
jgi:hypothetical protein